MNSISLRLKKNNKKAITPVIATIILIAVTLVLALVVGAYTFGLFGSNVKTVQLTSGILNAGAATVASGTAACSAQTPVAASFQLTFNNPGAATSISSLTISAGGTTITTFFYSAAAACTAAGATPYTSTDFPVANGAGVTVTVYVAGTNGLNSGTTYSYVISFANGQSIPGTLIAQ